MNRRVPLLAVVLLAVSMFPSAADAVSRSDRVVLEFDVMSPVEEPFTGTTNPIRGVPGGGLPWEIGRAEGELHSSGQLEVRVEGLVLARRAPVPAERQGTNPVPSFRAIVSCETVRDGAAMTVNASTGLAPATSNGDALLDGTVELPSPCLAPIVFVTSPDGAWFAVTGN